MGDLVIKKQSVTTKPYNHSDVNYVFANIIMIASVIFSTECDISLLRVYLNLNIIHYRHFKVHILVL